jgi:hypothetical protein
MINKDKENIVPDKTIAIFTNPNKANFDINNKERVFNLIKKSPKKREWFTPHFYRCLPLTIGNQYGFIITSEFDFYFNWNGSNEAEGINFYFPDNDEELNLKEPNIYSHFGSGIITISTPFTLRTPPGVNLMTINPPNYIVPNMSVMTGVIETDNIRRNFTFNLRIQVPHIQTFVPAGTPLAGFIPIPRYYADSFELKFAEELFSQKNIDEEIQAELDVNIYRQEIEPNLPNEVGRQYFLGEDVYGNKFSDHQKP